MAQKRNMSTLPLKPDYFIAHNGLPNILTTNATRRMIRQKAAVAATTTTMSSRNRMNSQQKNLCPLALDSQSHINSNNKSQKNRQNLLEAQLETNKRACLKKSEKDLINYETESSHRQGKLHNRLNSAKILSSTSSSSQKFEADSECNRNIKRWPKEEFAMDNKYSHQRRYDNTIFRHDLPNRHILPPLPI